LGGAAERMRAAAETVAGRLLRRWWHGRRKGLQRWQGRKR